MRLRVVKAGFCLGKGGELYGIKIHSCIQCHIQLFAVSNTGYLDDALISSITATVGKNNTTRN